MEEKTYAPALVVSIHDVCSRTQDAFCRWRELLSAWGASKRSLAVIPRYEGDQPLTADATLTALLREELQAGSEILLHGFLHKENTPSLHGWSRWRDRLTTRGCAEFAHMGGDEAREVISAGREELQSLLSCPIRGFTPPGWWISRAARDALAELGFFFCTRTFDILDLRQDHAIRSPAILGLPHRGPFSALLHCYGFRVIPVLQRRRLIRLALHPYDLDNPRFLRDAERLVRAALQTHELHTYEELVA